MGLDSVFFLGGVMVWDASSSFSVWGCATPPVRSLICRTVFVAVFFGFAWVADLSAQGISQAEFRQEMLVKCARAANALRSCSGTARVKHSFPITGKSGYNYSRFGNSGEKSYAVFGEQSLAEEIAANTSEFPWEIMASQYVSVSTPGLSFELQRSDGSAEYVVRGLAGVGDDRFDQIKGQIWAACGDIAGSFLLGEVDLSKPLANASFEITQLRQLEGSQYEFDFHDRVGAKEFSGTIVFDLELGGIVLGEVSGKDGQIAFRRTSQIDYHPQKTDIPVIQRVVSELTVNGTLRQRVETNITQFSWTAPDESIFDFRSYGVLGAQPPASPRLPRIVTLVLIVVLILAVIGVVWRRSVSGTSR